MGTAGWSIWRVHCKRQAAPCGDGFGLREQSLHSGLARSVIGMAHVETHAHRACESHCRHSVPHPRGPPWPQGLRCVARWIPPQAIHSAAPASASRRRCIGVVPAWLACPVHVRVCRVWPTMAVTAATLQILCLQNRALLNVDLEKAQRVVADGRLADLCGIEPEGADRGLQRDAVCIFQLEQGRIESSGNRAAADKRHAKAHALFFAEGNDFDGQRKLEFLRDLCTFERQRDAEDAVEGAGIGNGVNVRAENQALGSLRSEAAKVRAGCRQRLRALSCPEPPCARAAMLCTSRTGRSEKPARGAIRLLAHGGDAAALGNGALARPRASHERTCSLPRGLADECASGAKDRLAAQPGFEHAAPQFGAEVRREFMPKVQVGQARRSTWLRDRRRQSPRRRPPQSRPCARSSPPAGRAQPPSILRSAPSAMPRCFMPVHSTGSASPRLAMPPHA